MSKSSATVALLALTAGFLVGDVVTLPSGAGPVAPQVHGIALGAPDLRPLSAAVASVVAPGTEPGGLLQTDVLETQDFTVAGVSWTAEEDPARIEVRVREDGAWTGWQELSPNDEGPDAGTEEYERARAVSATDPLVSAGADALQVRVASVDGSVPEGLDVTVIDPGTSPADATTSQQAPLSSAGAAGAASIAPTVVTRAEWGADESLRGCTPSYSAGLKAVTIHHTAGTNNYTAAQSPSIVRGIYAYHTRSLGWCDVGYNFLVDKYGRVFEGRYGGMTRPVTGAHAGGFNNSTAGISAMGNYQEVAAPQVMVDAIARVAAWKLSLAGVQPQGVTSLKSAGGGTSRYSAGKVVELPTVFAHRDVGQTACPGSSLVARLGAIRTTAAALLADGNFVTALYADMLGRVPAASEVDYWVPRVRASNGRAAVSSGFAGSEEYRTRAITAAYVDVLARQPEAAGLASWYGQILAGRTRVDDIRRTFLASTEFYQQGGGTDQGYVKLLFTRALGRQPSATELSHWTGKLRTAGRASVIRSIYDSPEGARIRVDRAYREWLERTAGPSERSYWEALVIAQGDEAMRQAVMVSQEYFNLAQR